MATQSHFDPQIDSTTHWKRFLQGDKVAFEEIYNRYYERLYQYGRHLAPDEHVVRDSIQTLFVDLWQRKKYLSITSNVQGYLFKALRRVIIRQLQEQRRRTVPAPILVPSREEEIIQKETNRLSQKQVQQALAQLTKHQREVVHLRFFANLSNQQIASTLNISVATVYNIISLSLAKLRSHYAEKTILIWLVSLLM
ncbi:RNA polymerase sigma factor [Tunicatimonas pelagia]|uniref:RNA polymerase sigma factor n=1 Tax=Tunicatimonas pelagia TaxID=931531 RepID=UPI002664E89E|nr:sigma-70 family RNA polymerase sigma factor [Tunicatimonas pelagia]WKN41800.1 sigma-70 family RNA polymerase sigma factor [Tunicatimonas pelagia]